MRRIVYTALPLFLLIWLASFLVSETIGIITTIVGFLIVFSVGCFVVMNFLLKKTNWWKNQYIATEQFVSNYGYRDNLIRNYDIINLGSNPAHYAFFYEGVKGQSWATGSQGQDMDFEILKYFHSYLKEGGTVLIPIMPFTAISPYLKERSEYWGVPYYSKFAKILDSAQVSNLPYGRQLSRYLRFPLLYNLKAIVHIFHDVPQNQKYQISEQPLMKMELQQDASKWVNGWLREFRLKSLYDVFDSRWKKYYKESVEMNKLIVSYCLDRGLRPVFICVPMTRHLSSRFPEEFYKYMIKDFVKDANIRNIPFLDYTQDGDFQNDSLYFNSFFLNLRGRKLFTRKVLKDLGLV